MSDSNNSIPETEVTLPSGKQPMKDALARSYLQTLLDLDKEKNKDKHSEIRFTPRLAQGGPVPSEPLPIRPDIALLAVQIARQVEKHPGLAGRLKRGGPVVTIKCRDEDECEPIETALEKCVVGCKSVSQFPYGRIAKQNQFLLVTNSNRLFRYAHSKDLSLALAHGLSVIGVAADPHGNLPVVLCRAAECELELEAPDASAIRLALQYVTGEQRVPDIADEVAALLTPSDLVAAVRPGRPIEDAIAQLGRMAAERGQDKKASVKPSGPKLEEIHGYGLAKVWGLDAVKDIGAYRAGEIPWGDVDHRGLLLSGAPGTGKTMFARAFANSCGLPLIATSVAEWNAHPYMSGTLGLIRKTFAEARKKAPVVLFIDELDGVSSRDAMTGEWAQYWTQVVNILLEEMQGTTSNEGIVLIGATNHPGKIDPAVLRSGRLDHHVRIELPGIADLKAILCYCLGESPISDEALSRIAVASLGSTGADIDAFVRRARGAARREKAHLSERHLMTAVNPDNGGISPESLRHVSVHEAGHAVVHHLTGAGRFENMALTKHGGHLTITAPLSPHSGKADLEKLILCLLAGAAAEQIVFGDISMNHAIGEDNDLVRASGLCARIELTFEDPIGYSGNLEQALMAVPGLLQKVRGRLANASKECRKLLLAERDLLEAVADELERSHHIDRPAFEALCARYGHAGRARILEEVA